MSCSCCNNTSTKKERMKCTECGQNCFPVSRQTMLHQIRFPDNQNMTEDDYSFCANHDCSVGYFSTSAIIPKVQLRAFQLDQPVMLCHCFDISEKAYRTAMADGTAESIKAFVVQQTKEKLCACESRNPSGRCCLVNFSQMEKEHRG